ncbi:MAG: universal stress protein [Eggerthellaceae bacterium]|jgi:nucleotide-binding universal stress UspA family protein
MWCSKILVAYDGSIQSQKALQLAAEIGKEDPSIEVVLVHVMKIYANLVASGADTALLDEAENRCNELEDFSSKLANKSHVVLLKGTSPADLILQCARDEACDLIAMGSRGMSGVKGYLGSVSAAVVQGSNIPVLIAKDSD